MNDENKKFLVSDDNIEQELNNQGNASFETNELVNEVNSNIDINSVETNDNKILEENLSNLENKSKDFEVNMATLYSDNVEDKEFSYHIEEEPLENDNIRIKETPDNKTKKSRDYGVLLLLFAIIGMIGFFFDDMILFIGLCLCFVCFISSIIVLKKSSLYAKIALTFSFVEIMLYVLMLLLGFRFINNKLEGTMAEEFKNDAKAFISEVDKKIDAKNNFICNGKNIKRTKIYLNEIDNFSKLSPLKNKYNEQESYVLIETEEENRQCVYRYYVFLKEEKYSLGTYAKPVLMENIDKTNVMKNSIYK